MSALWRDTQQEMLSICADISRISEDGATTVFGSLFADSEVQDKYEALLSTLLAARKGKLITFQGELLLQGQHDNVVITLTPLGQGMADDDGATETTAEDCGAEAKTRDSFLKVGAELAGQVEPGAEVPVARRSTIEETHAAMIALDDDDEHHDIPEAALVGPGAISFMNASEKTQDEKRTSTMQGAMMAVASINEEKRQCMLGGEQFQAFEVQTPGQRRSRSNSAFGQPRTETCPERCSDRCSKCEIM